MELTHLRKLNSPSRNITPSETSNFGTPIVTQLIDLISLGSKLENTQRGPLQKQFQLGKASNLREAILLLDLSEKKQIFSRLSVAEIERLVSISQESNPQLFSERLYIFGQEQLKEGKNGQAAITFNQLTSPTHKIPTELVKRSQAALQLIHGYGSLKDQVEHSFTRFFPSTFSLSLILPMSFATTVGKRGSLFAIKKIALKQGFAQFLPSFLSHGLGARVAVGGISLLFESPAFVAAGWGIKKLAGEKSVSSPLEFTKEAALASIPLGLLKFSGFIGNQSFLKLHRFNELGIPKLNRYQRFTQIMIPYSAMWWGLYGAHRIEAAMGLRPEVAGPIALTEVTTSLLSLTFGYQAGNWLLGPSYLNLGKRWGIQTQIFTRFLDHPELLPQLKLSLPGRRLTIATIGLDHFFSIQNPVKLPSLLETGSKEIGTKTPKNDHKKNFVPSNPGSNLVEKYFQEINRHPLLTVTEEIELTEHYLKTSDKKTFHRLVNANLRYVVAVAREYAFTPQHLLDLIQEGNLGLIIAVKKFDPQRGNRLITYAAWWIRASIGRFVLNNFRLVKLGATPEQRKVYANLQKETERLESMGFEANDEQLAQALEVAPEVFQETAARIRQSDLSLDAKFGPEGDTSLIDILPSNEANIEEVVIEKDYQAQLKETLRNFSKSLKVRDQMIMKERLLAEHPLTLQEIGIKLGVSRERVRQVEDKLIARLRIYLQRHRPDKPDKED